jgi:hypothetical protein
MGKKPKKIVTKSQRVPTEKLVDKWTQIVQRTLQVLSLFFVIILLVLRGFVDNFKVEDYVIIGLMGLAVGLNPDQIRTMFVDIIKAFIGRKS